MEGGRREEEREEEIALRIGQQRVSSRPRTRFQRRRQVCSFDISSLDKSSAVVLLLNASHHITTHLISSHLITSHHFTSHLITSHHFTSHHITSQLSSSVRQIMHNGVRSVLQVCALLTTPPQRSHLFFMFFSVPHK